MEIQTNLFDKPKEEYKPSYFNTTNLQGGDLVERQEKVRGQNLEILSMFANNPQVEMTPWDIYEKLGGKAPITSVRRAITTLESKGYLLKSDGTKRCGPYKDFSHSWQFHPKSL